MSNYRAPLRTIQVDLKAGELSPLFRMRTDSEALGSGARFMRNMLLQVTGSATRRPGTTVRAKLKKRSRLIEFEFDANEKYIFAFQDDGLQVFDKYGTLLRDFTPAEIPWQGLDNDFWEMGHVQKGDVMILAHGSFKMRRIRRTGLTTFVSEALEFSTDTAIGMINQPHTKYEHADVTLSISSTTKGNDRLVTCSKGIFTAAWVGERIRIYNKELKITSVTGAKTCRVTVYQDVNTELGIAPFRYTEGSRTIEVTHALHGLATGATITIAGAQKEVGIDKKNINGPRTITVIDEDRYTFECGDEGSDDKADDSIDGGGTNITISTTSPTRRWTEQVWSDRRGWPSAIALHENRLWLGGSRSNPTFLAASAVGNYFDFNPRDGLDDESVQGTIASLSRIQYLVSGKVLQIFTEAAEAIVETSQGDPVTPGTLKVVTQTYYGSHRYGLPRIFDGGTIFIQKNAKNIRELVYDFNTDSHASVPISMLASHMISTPHDLAVLQGTGTRPEQYCFIVNGSNTVPIFHSIRSEKMAAWSLMVMAARPAGKARAAGTVVVDSCCAMGADVFFSVLRDGQYTLERFELDPMVSHHPQGQNRAEPQVWLDAAQILWALGDTKLTRLVLDNTTTRYRDTYVTVISTRSKYTARLWSDNASQVALPKGLLTPIVVGFDHGVVLQPNPADKEMNDGQMTGEKRRVLSTNIHLDSSVSCAINGKETLGLIANELPAAWTGKKKIRHLGYSIDPLVTITQPIPGPLTILGMVHEVSI